MSNLYADTDIDVVRISLLPKAGGAAVDYYFALDYWAPGTVYTTNPAFYPLLVSPPLAQRGVDSVALVKFSTQIQIHGDSHLDNYGSSLIDLLKNYEVHNAVVQLLYYVKPSTPGAVTTHSDSVNIRQQMRAVSLSFDEASGVATINCADMTFRDKEISKRLSSAILPGLDPQEKGAYGAIVFGQSTDGTSGIAIDAPYFDSFAPPNSSPGPAVAKLFSGWRFFGHPNDSFKRLFVKNPDLSQNKSPWLVVALDTNPQLPGYGEAVTLPVADPPNWPRDLTRYKRAIVNQPSANGARILTAVRSYVKVNTRDRCVSISESQYLANIGNPGSLARGDGDFSIEIWVLPTLLHDGTVRRIICEQGSQNKGGKLEWQVYFNTTDDKPWFGLSSNGTSIGKSVTWSANLLTSNWYAIYCVYDAINHVMKINVNAGTTVTASTASFSISQQQGGIFSVGSRKLGAGAENLKSFNGYVKNFRYWSRALSDGDILYLYNSGAGHTTDTLDDYRVQDLEASNELNDPFGTRYAIRGSLDLSPNTLNAALITNDVPYQYATFAAITPDNKYGEISVSIDEVDIQNSSNPSANPKNKTAGKATIDVTSPALASGTSNCFFQFDPPVVMAPGGVYTTILDMANADTNTYFATCAYDANAGSTHQALDKRTKKDSSQPAPNWVQQPQRLDMQHYYVGMGDGWARAGSSPNYYSYLGLAAKQITPLTGQIQRTFVENLQFKICISGLQDLTTFYTGSIFPGALIERPCDIILFTLCNSSFGLGLSSVADVDTPAFQQARADLAACYPGGLKMQVVIDSQTSAEQFILEICRQSRMIFYKTKQGLLSIKVPRYTTVADFSFAENYHRGEFQLISVADNDFGSVVNDFDNLYERDTFFLSSDLASDRRNPGEKLANELIMNKDVVTSGDNDRRVKCQTSEAIYGKRENKLAFSFYDSSTWAQPVQNYLCDRYSTLQKRAVFRVPRSVYYNSLDLFSMVRLQHTAISDANGTAFTTSAFSSGTAIATYDEGVPSVPWAGGQLEGQVYEVQEQGPWMIVTIETVSGYT